MKTKTHSIIIVLCIAFTAITQPLQAQVDTSNTEKLINYILQSVDKSQVPTFIFASLRTPAI
ncbi:MAG: hypothetical protein H7101_11360 [Deinococcales bacterium]|nr:hypothetical protein [Chitinophagaceae bacterium]